MTRTRLLSIAVVVLVLMNMATLAVLFFRKPPHPEHGKREGPKKVIIERLKFDAGQVAAYEDVIRYHRQQIDSMDMRMMELRGTLYASYDGITSDSLIALIGETQVAIEHVHVGHFTDIQMLCREDQFPLYEELSKDLARYFRHEPPPPKKQ